MRSSKAGGGRGTNQYAVKGKPKTPPVPAGSTVTAQTVFDAFRSDEARIMERHAELRSHFSENRPELRELIATTEVGPFLYVTFAATDPAAAGGTSDLVVECEFTLNEWDPQPDNFAETAQRVFGFGAIADELHPVHHPVVEWADRSTWHLTWRLADNGSDRRLWACIEPAAQHQSRHGRTSS